MLINEGWRGAKGVRAFAGWHSPRVWLSCCPRPPWGKLKTIAATETIGWFCKDGEMKETTAQYTMTLLLEAEQVVRTSLYDLKAKKVIPDDTKYQGIELASHSPAILKGGPIEDSFFPPVVRAVGFPGTDAVEILTIGKDFIQSVKSTSTYFVIYYMKREK